MDLAVLRTTVCTQAAEFNPSSLSPVGATVAVEHWAAIERSAASAKLRAALSVDAGGLDGDGVVADASGTTTGRARRQKRAAAAAAKPGPLGDAFRNGQLSAEQTESITSATAVAPDAEAELVGLSTTVSAAELRAACDRVRIDALNSNGRLADEQKARRYLRHWTDQYGMTRFDAALEPVAGATVIAALNQLADRAFRAAVRAKTEAGTPEQRAADALAELATNAGAAGAGAGAKTRRGPRAVVRIIVDEHGAATVDGTPVPPDAVAQVIADPDTVVQTVTTNGHDVTRIETHARYIPKALRDALETRDPTCVVKGCGRTQGLEIDHVTPFAHGGPTTLHNLCRLCRHHHRLKTLGRYTLTRDRDGWKFQPIADGRAPPRAHE